MSLDALSRILDTDASISPDTLRNAQRTIIRYALKHGLSIRETEDLIHMIGT